MRTSTWNGEHLRQARLRKGMSQNELSWALRTSARNINRWENNHNLPSSDSVQALAQALEVDTSFFFGENGSEADEDEEESELVLSLVGSIRALVQAELGKQGAAA